MMDVESEVSQLTTENAMKNQNDLALIHSQRLFSTKPKQHLNTVFSPASINAALTLAASGPVGSSSAKEILSFLSSSSIEELNAVFSQIASVVFADRSANGGPKISSVNGVWIEQSLPIDDSSFKVLFENFFKASFDRVDFRSKDFSRIFFHVASRASLHKRASMAHNTWFALLTKISPILPRTTKVDAKRKICSHNAEHLCRGQSCRGWQYKSIGMEHARLWS
ncbi:unnamed protein product [Microthlaspi erraticum]|uniref:Serpin domain-containing protein n=1 Tax=Microthlaspi erraticum TaxID=1685480 RepID=A0A6D2KHF2_9BRAS|nr:unnamed protein product [Microthlaspi erraticum]